MNCPVCKTECTNETVCPECGFTEVGKVFLNIEDANQWIDFVVSPYRIEYEKRQILPPLDWLEIFKKIPQAKALFDIEIPASIRKREYREDDIQPNNNDAVGHIALISEDDNLISYFINEFSELTNQQNQIQTETLDEYAKCGDIPAILTNLNEYETAALKISGKVDLKVIDVLADAMSDYALYIDIGRGPSAEKIKINLCPFTVITIVKNMRQLPKRIEESVSFIIDLNKVDKLNEYQIREYASMYNVSLTKSTLDIIKEDYQRINLKTLFRLISDYLFLHPEKEQPVSSEELRRILVNL